MVYSSFELELSYWDQGMKLVCGVDEVGRGCFAGPVVAGAVIFPSNFEGIPGLADSKLLTPEKREYLSQIIQEKALYFAVGEISVETINKVGIGKATQLAFVEAIRNLGISPEQILIDAFFIQGLPKDNQSPIKNGDKISSSIAAASIIAKVYRDKLMAQLDLEYPEYGFAKHKGYGTKEHQVAIKNFGLSEIHRKSFNLDKFL